MCRLRIYANLGLKHGPFFVSMVTVIKFQLRNFWLTHNIYVYYQYLNGIINDFMGHRVYRCTWPNLSLIAA